MATLDELVVRIRADATQLERELKRVTSTTQQQTNAIASSIGGLKTQFTGLIPALAASSLVAFGKLAIGQADHINDLAQRIGFMGSTLSSLNIPLRQSGSDLDEFSASVTRMNNMIGEAAKGTNQEAVKAFDNLGLSVRKLQQLSPEQQFFAVADALGHLGEQGKLTEAGMNIFGRSFVTMIPLLRQAKDGMGEFVEEQKKAGNALTDERLGKIDEFGDKWTEAVEKLKMAMTNAVPALKLYMDGLTGILNLPQNASDAALQLEDTAGLLRRQSAPGRGYTDRPATVNEATFGKGYSFNSNGSLVSPGSASGNNAGLLKQNSAEAYLSKLKQQATELAIPQPARAGQQAVDEMKNAAAKEGIALTKQQIDLARQLATANYEAQNPNPVQEYIRNLEEETQELHANQNQRAGMKAVFELENQIRKDGIALSEEERQRIIALADANEELRKKTEEAERESKRMHDQLRDGLTDLILHFNSAGDAAKAFFDDIANAILKRSITGPLVDALVGSEGGGGLVGGFFKDTFGGFFADGGSPPVGRPSIVGENGPEIFVPNTAGTILPNGVGMGGGGPTIMNTWNIQSGVTRQELAGRSLSDRRRGPSDRRSLMPMMEARATANTLAAVERGGRASQIVGKRS